MTTAPVLLTQIPTIILTGKNSLLSIFSFMLARLSSTEIAMAHTITLIRTEARTTTMAVVPRHTQLPVAAALARSESGPSLTFRVLDWLVGRQAYVFSIAMM